MGGTYAFGSGKIKIVVNGNNIATDVAPKNVNGRVLVPISTISKALGANVSWDSKTQTVSIQQGTSNPKTTDVWSQSLNDTSAEEWAAVKRTIDLFIIGYDGQDEELVKSLVVEGNAPSREHIVTAPAWGYLLIEYHSLILKGIYQQGIYNARTVNANRKIVLDISGAAWS
ncbi:copper amine oxidase N-terminal domain-containing protein [Paenibacillus solani]